MKKITCLNILILLAACGPSQEERENIALNACSIMSETKKSDSLFRIQTIIDAREKIGGQAFVRGDDAIKEALEFGICTELVLNKSYDEILQPLKNAKLERERIAAEKLAEEKRIAAEKLAEEKRIAAEKQRIADSKPTVKEEFYGTGRLKSRTNYQPRLNGGKKHGIRVEYFENGRLNSKANYKNGQLDGNYEEYFESLQLMKKANYKNGQIDGTYEEYFESGQLYIKKYYKNGQGTFEQYFRNGQLEAKGNYKNGQIDGTYEEYFESGQLYRKGNYKNGQPEGPFEMYKEHEPHIYKGIQLSHEGNYKNGQLEGPIVEYKLTYSPVLSGNDFNLGGGDFVNLLYKITYYKNGLREGPMVEYIRDRHVRDINLAKIMTEGIAEVMEYEEIPWTKIYEIGFINFGCYKIDEEIIMAYCENTYSNELRGLPDLMVNKYIP